MNYNKSAGSSWFADNGRFTSGPLLILPSNQETDEEGDVGLGLFSLKDKKIHDLNMVFKKSQDVIASENEDIRIVGSSHGWLMILSKHAKLSLLNVFSNSCIELPAKPDSESQRTLIDKAILTANPSRDDSYKVIIIYGLKKKLAFYCCGDETWTAFSNCQDYYDLIWYENMLFTLREGVTIEGWSFADSCLPTQKISVRCCYTTSLSYPCDRCTTQWYIVPFSGEILFIVRYIGEFVNHKGDLLCEADLLSEEDSHPLVCPYRTFKFQVYKVDMIKKRLEEVGSLKDQVIFLGGNHGFSVSARDYPELKGNSIYFTDDYWDRMYEDYLYGGHDIGIFIAYRTRVLIQFTSVIFYTDLNRRHFGLCQSSLTVISISLEVKVVVFRAQVKF